MNECEDNLSYLITLENLTTEEEKKAKEALTSKLLKMKFSVEKFLGNLGIYNPEYFTEESVFLVLEKAWKSRFLFDRKKGTLDSWLFIIFKNQCVDLIRTKAREKERISLKAWVYEHPSFLRYARKIGILYKTQPGFFTELGWKIIKMDIRNFPFTPTKEEVENQLGSSSDTIKNLRSRAYRRLKKYGICDFQEMKKSLKKEFVESKNS